MDKFQLLLIIYIHFINNIICNFLKENKEIGNPYDDSGYITCVQSYNVTCDCELFNGGVRFYCPQKNNFKIKVSASIGTLVKCDKTMSVHDYEMISSIDLSNFYRFYAFYENYPGKLIFENCVIPPNGFEDIVRKFKKPEWLKLDESLPSDHKFRREHFHGFDEIKVLEVQSTEVVTLPLYTFDNLKDITQLYLTIPNVQGRNGEIFRNQRKLEKLELRQTAVNFTKELFINLSSITRIHIEKSVQHGALPSDAFEWLPHVMELRMEANNLTALPSGLFHANGQLETLAIKYEPELKTQPNDLLVNLKNLTEFTLSFTSIETIHVDYFAKTTKLTSIDMSNNKLTSLPEAGFYRLKDLVTINLANNKFTKSITMPMVGLFSLESVNLSHNALTKFPTLSQNFKKFKELDLSYNQIDRISVFDLTANSAPLSVYLANNSLTTIDFASFLGVTYIPLDTTLHLGGNPINCDARLRDFVDYIEDSNGPLRINVVGGECSAPSHLAKRPLSQIDFNDIVHQLSDFCSAYCPCPCDCNYRRDDKMIVMNCTKDGLSQLDRFPNTTGLAYKNIELNFASQSVTEIPDLNRVPGMENVIFVNASNNNIHRFSREMFSNNWQRLDLSNNKLVSLDNDLISLWIASKKLEKLWLSGNPLECDCDTQKQLMQQFVYLNASRVPDHRHITCANRAEKPLYEIDDLCTDIYFVVIALCLSALFVTLLFALYYKYRELISVWLYAKFGRSIGKYLSDKPYDAFISYAEPDSDYVFNHLVPDLENGPERYRLCIHERDWIAAPIIEQIYESVHNSRYTIIVLSRNFLRSMWCVAEFRAAQVQANEERRSNVIMVMYGDVSDDDIKNGALKEMQAYLRANTYLKWDDPWFLEKLRYSLRRSRRDRIVRRTNDNDAIEMTVQQID